MELFAKIRVKDKNKSLSLTVNLLDPKNLSLLDDFSYQQLIPAIQEEGPLTRPSLGDHNISNIGASKLVEALHSNYSKISLALTGTSVGIIQSALKRWQMADGLKSNSALNFLN